MKDGAGRILKSIVGQEGIEALQKAIYRKQTQSVADPMELYLPLMVVPRAILSWLVQNIQPLKMGEHKEFKFPGKEDVKIQVEKQSSDVYRGRVIQAGKVIHDFDKQSLPSIGGHLMTLFEQYDHLIDQPVVIPRKEAIDEHKKIVSALKSPSKKDDKEQLAEQLKELEQYKAGTEPKHVSSGDLGIVKTIMNMNGISIESTEPGSISAMMQLASIKALTESISQLIDALVAKKVKADMDKNEIKADDGKPKDCEVPKPPKNKENKTLGEVRLNAAKMDAKTHSKILSDEYAADERKEGKAAKDAKPIKKEEKSSNRIRLRSVYSKKTDLGDHPGSFMSSGEGMGKDELDKGAMAPGGAGMPKQPKMPAGPAKPVGPSKNPQGAQMKQAQGAMKQSIASGMGKQTAPAVGSINKPIINPAKNTNSKPKLAMKNEISEVLNRPANHLKRHLRDLIKPVVKKTEEHHVSESELYAKCEHCGTAEFKKTASGPVFSPCACFIALTKDDEGKAINFVALKKADDGYKLSFNPSADEEAKRTFLLFIKSRLLIKKRFGV